MKDRRRLPANSRNYGVSQAVFFCFSPLSPRKQFPFIEVSLLVRYNIKRKAIEEINMTESFAVKFQQSIKEIQ